MENKNWLKVFLPEVGMVILTLSVFSGCRWFGMGDDSAAAIAIVTLGVVVFTVVALATASAAVALALATAFIATTTATAFIATTTATTTATTVAVATATTVATTVAVATVAATAVLVNSFFILEEENLGLSKFWVSTSFMAEAAAIFFPIYLSLN